MTCRAVDSYCACVLVEFSQVRNWYLGAASVEFTIAANDASHAAKLDPLETYHTPRKDEPT